MTKSATQTSRLLRWACTGLSVVPGAAAMAQGPAATLEAASRPAAVLPDAPSFLQAPGTRQLPTGQTPAAQPEAGTASISGVVEDVGGALVPGATVTLMDGAGKPGRSVTASSDGRFRLDRLPPGTYTLKISATGLQSFEPPPVVVKPGEQVELPDVALPIATSNQTVDVVVTQEMIADQELADETKQRVLGVLPNFFTSYEWNAAPLNAKQKFRLTLRATTDPTAFIVSAIVAGVEQDRNTFPGYGDDAAAYGKRFGAAYGDAFIGRFIGAAILPSIFHQDPRYFYMGPPSTTKQRFLHAIAFSVTARSDRGHDGHLMPNYSHILGNFTAGYISKLYHPDANRGITLAVDNALIGIGGSAVQGLVREFVLKHVSTHTPPYAKGKTRDDARAVPESDIGQAPTKPASAKP